MVRLKVVEVPAQMATEILFQFHMVRLKEIMLICYFVVHVRFQFHMVRLKATRLTQQFTGKQFQFHMVRLKEEEVVIVVARLGFNSTWYD